MDFDAKLISAISNEHSIGVYYLIVEKYGMIEKELFKQGAKMLLAWVVKAEVPCIWCDVIVSVLLSFLPYIWR